jgi:hypothetical protein
MSSSFPISPPKLFHIVICYTRWQVIHWCQLVIWELLYHRQPVFVGSHPEIELFTLISLNTSRDTDFTTMTRNWSRY